MHRRSYYPALKRVLDITAAGVFLVLAAPAMLGAGLLIWATMGRPVFFRQRRPGRLCRPFTLLKFRTMTEARDAGGKPLPDGERLTRVGRWLRRLSLDGARLATAGMDGTVRVYALRLEDLIALAKTRVTRGLTDAECVTYLHVPACPAK